MQTTLDAPVANGIAYDNRRLGILKAGSAYVHLDTEYTPERVSVLDVYEHRTIAPLAAVLDAPRCATEASAGGESKPRGPSESGRHFLAGLAQSAGLYVEFGFNAIQWVTPCLLYFLLRAEGYSLLMSVAWAAVSAMLVFPLLLSAVIAIKWLVLGRIRPGRYPLWGWYYLRWWLVQTLISGLPLDYLARTPLLPWVFRLLGARIGRDAHLATEHLAAFDSISIGEGACVDDDASLYGYRVEDGELVIGPVQLGPGCFVGTWSVLHEGTVMKEGARLEDLSLLQAGARVPAGQTWSGSPARRIERTADAPSPAPLGPSRRTATAVSYAALVLALPLVLLAALVPGVAFLMKRTMPLVGPGARLRRQTLSREPPTLTLCIPATHK